MASRPKTMPLQQMLELGLLQEGDLLRFLKVRDMRWAAPLWQVIWLLLQKRHFATGPQSIAVFVFYLFSACSAGNADLCSPG